MGENEISHTDLLDKFSEKLDAHQEAVLNRVDNFERSVTAQFVAGTSRMGTIEAVAREAASTARSNHAEIQKSVGFINAMKYIAAGIGAGVVLLIGWMVALAKDFWSWGGGQ